MPPPLLLLIAPVRALCFGGEDHLKSRRRGHPGFPLSLSRPSDGTRARSELKIITVIIITTIRAPVSMLVLFTFPSFLLSFLCSNPWPV
ncbi:hypothetical protein TYRP_007001 [Tyrophagus putrescentiae]|nr:hypothetical protein TYRP_007001 [Tyrophagus putrescentiae]